MEGDPDRASVGNFSWGGGKVAFYRGSGGVATNEVEEEVLLWRSGEASKPVGVTCRGVFARSSDWPVLKNDSGWNLF